MSRPRANHPSTEVRRFAHFPVGSLLSEANMVAGLLSMRALSIGSWREGSLAKLSQRRIDGAAHHHGRPVALISSSTLVNNSSPREMPAALQAWLDRGAKAAAIAHHPNDALALLDGESDKVSAIHVHDCHLVHLCVPTHRVGTNVARRYQCR
jgi:hypothetical protein